MLYVCMRDRRNKSKHEKYFNCALERERGSRLIVLEASCVAPLSIVRKSMEVQEVSHSFTVSQIEATMLVLVGYVRLQTKMGKTNPFLNTTWCSNNGFKSIHLS